MVSITKQKNLPKSSKHDKILEEFIAILAKNLVNHLIVKLPQGTIALKPTDKRTRTSINVLNCHIEVVYHINTENFFLTASSKLKREIKRQLILNPLSLNDINNYHEKENINKEYHYFS